MNIIFFPSGEVYVSGSPSNLYLPVGVSATGAGAAAGVGAPGVNTLGVTAFFFSTTGITKLSAVSVVKK